MILLEYPYTTPTLSLTLKNPAYGDADQWEYKKKIGYTMDSTIYTYVSPVVNEKLVLRFNNLRDADVTNLRAFLDGVGNDYAKYTDQLLSVWRVRVVSNPVQIIHVRDCLYETTLELRGAKIS